MPGFCGRQSCQNSSKKYPLTKLFDNLFPCSQTLCTCGLRRQNLYAVTIDSDSFILHFSFSVIVFNKLNFFYCISAFSIPLSLLGGFSFFILFNKSVMIIAMLENYCSCIIINNLTPYLLNDQNVFSLYTVRAF